MGCLGAPEAWGPSAKDGPEGKIKLCLGVLPLLVRCTQKL